MHLDVAFTPADVHDVASTACIVIDVIRATTTITTLFAHGLKTVYVARTLDSGRRFARSNGLTLCGEEGGAKPADFDFGNSPLEIAERDWHGQEAVLCTTNGTVALHAVYMSPAVFVGSLANATAAVHTALAAAPADRLTMVCSGRSGAFALDDAWCAGALVGRALTLAPGATCSDRARAALMLTLGTPSAHDALHLADSAKSLGPLGLLPDVTFASQIDRFAVAPQLVTSRLDVRYPVRLAPAE